MKTTRRHYETMTADEIFAAWEQAARDGLRKGHDYAPEIFAPRGRTVKAYKRAIRVRMQDAARPFNAGDFRKSTRVARDIGRICSILAAADEKHIVRLDVFQKAADLATLHPACPSTKLVGGGRWCDRG
jgi:hypothetical protein